MDEQSHKYLPDPFKRFFPLGTLLALIGGGIWFFTGSDHYPLVFHSQTMIGSFLFSFISGFLMTAAPRMTGSFPARKFEVNGMLALILISVVFNIFEMNRAFFIVELLSFFLLFYFVGARVNLKRNFPPPFFVLVFFGILSGVTGSALLAFDEQNLIGRNLYFNGIILFLVLGVGTKLIPGLRGIQSPMNGVNKEFRELGASGFIIFVSLFGEIVGNALFWGLFKSAACFFIAVSYWRIFSFSRPQGRLAYGVWISSYMVLAGIILKTIYPDYATQWMHLTYIGGFGMMTFTVASRVINSHGGFNMNFEKQSMVPLMVVFLLGISALIRVAAPYFNYLELLKWAAAFWIMGTLVWGYIFVPRCLGVHAKN